MAFVHLFIGRRICKLSDQIVAVLQSLRWEAREAGWGETFIYETPFYTQAYNPSREKWEKYQKKKKKEIGCSRSLLRNSEVKKERCEKREGGFKPNTRETSPQKLLAGHQGGSSQEAGGTQRESLLLFRARGWVRGWSKVNRGREKTKHFCAWEGAGELIKGEMTAKSHPDLPPSQPGDLRQVTCILQCNLW